MERAAGKHYSGYALVAQSTPNYGGASPVGRFFAGMNPAADSNKSRPEDTRRLKYLVAEAACYCQPQDLSPQKIAQNLEHTRHKGRLV